MLYSVPFFKSLTDRLANLEKNNYTLTMNDFAHYKLGENEDMVKIDTMQENRDVTNSMVTQATRSIHIFTQDFDAIIYNTPRFIEAIKDVAIHDSHSFVKIIVKDPKKAILHGHRIIELYRRLTSHIQIRKAGHEYNQYSAAYLIADETAYIRRPEASRYEAIASFNARSDCRHLLTFFNSAWERALPAPELNRLHI